ncbi:hypothetical protein GWK47_024244 [Chionoecetes opilio]|uniref:Uncharacterized protein n=1 Tax=Chionoecetes opilio TaxID=41210 RepID=A0A8J5CDV5_CHIOP|nr:hypothetical protein GWK47_024244 [Chionoecetes opilio]
MAEKTWWAPREVNLTLSAAAATSFVIFSLFGREAEAAALARAEDWCRTKKLMNQHIQQWRELPVTNSIISPLSKVSANSFSFLLLSAANLSCFLDSFAMLSLSTVLITIFLWPLWSSRKSLSFCLRWVMEEEVAGAAMSNIDAKCPWRRVSETLSRSD